jgi:hypothetical protein
VCREDWEIQILHGIQPLCLITRFGEGIEKTTDNFKSDIQAKRVGRFFFPNMTTVM